MDPTVRFTVTGNSDNKSRATVSSGGRALTNGKVRGLDSRRSHWVVLTTRKSKVSDNQPDGDVKPLQARQERMRLNDYALDGRQSTSILPSDTPNG